MLSDLRFALRALRRSPGFTAVAVLCLAVAIGVNTVSFSILNALAFRPLPGVERESRLLNVYVGRTLRGERLPPGRVGLDHEALRAGVTAFAELAAAARVPTVVEAGGAGTAVLAEAVSARYFAALGTRAARGRLLDASDDALPVAVVGHELWRSRLGGRDDAIGGTVRVNGARSRWWASRRAASWARRRAASRPRSSWCNCGCRSAWLSRSRAPHDGRPTSRGCASWAGCATTPRRSRCWRRWTWSPAGWPAERPDGREGLYAHLTGVRHGSTDRPGEIAALIALLMSVPAVVLAVACANLANLQLARAARRGREIAVRLSLGAARGRVVRLLLVESLLVAAAGSALGLLLSFWATELASLFALRLPFEVPVDARVLAYACAAALLTGVAFGLGPALGATRGNVAAALTPGAPGTGRGRSRLRGALVAGQVAASLVLLVACGLFLRTTGALRRVDTGIVRERLVVASADLGIVGVPPAAAATRLAVALDRLRADGAVEAAGLASFRPFAGMEERRVGPRDGSVSASWVKGGRVSAAGSPRRACRCARPRVRRAGRARSAPAVAIVNETLARRLGAGAAVVGARVRVDSTLDAEIVGVVADVAPAWASASSPRSTCPAAQGELTAATLYVRARGDAEPGGRGAAAGGRRARPAAARAEAHTRDELLRRELGPWSMIVAGTGFFGLIALLLAPAASMR
jgi:hypothetical protein